jgi:hypothetical protein
MRKTLVILTLTALMLFMAVSAGATGIMDFQPPWVDEVPEMNPIPWESGQYGIYNFAIEVEGEEITLDIRFALIGEETIGGEDYYWFEVDAYNIGDLPEDVGMGEEFESFKLQILMKEYDMTSAQDDPEAFLEDLFSLEFIKRVIFQLNDETPMEIDMSFLAMMAPMLEQQMEMAMEDEDIQEEMTGMWDDAEWGYEFEDISTRAGSFSDALHLWFKYEAGGSDADMEIYSHQDVPLMMMVKMIGEIKEGDDTVDMELELIEYGDDATGWITGEPEMFSFDMMGGMMGEM